MSKTDNRTTDPCPVVAVATATRKPVLEDRSSVGQALKIPPQLLFHNLQLFMFIFQFLSHEHDCHIEFTPSFWPPN